MVHALSTSSVRARLFREAGATLAAALLAFAAFDDITTDRAASFTFEWLGLAGCSVWFAVVSVRVLRREPRWLGAASVCALMAGVTAGSFIRSGTGSFQIVYLLTVLALLWFLVLSVILAAQANRVLPLPLHRLHRVHPRRAPAGD